jgi:hypothetical protein
MSSADTNDTEAQIRLAVRRELVAAKLRGELLTSRHMIGRMMMRGFGRTEPRYVLAQAVRDALTEIAATRSCLGEFAAAVRRAHLRVVN